MLDAPPPTSTPIEVGEQASLQSNACIQPNDGNLEIQHALQSQDVDGVREVREGKNTDNTVITSSQGSVSGPSEQQNQRPQNSEIQRSQSLNQDNQEKIGQGM